MEKRRRRSIRLRGFDYRTPGAYFVTICTYRREHLFNEAPLAEIAQETWLALPDRFPTVILDEWIVMPNHLHFVLWLGESTPANSGPTLGAVVGAFKSLVARDWLRWINHHAPHRSARVWQRNYYERIIRTEQELNNVRAYIRNNPTRWAKDRDNLDALLARMTEHTP